MSGAERARRRAALSLGIAAVALAAAAVPAGAQQPFAATTGPSLVSYTAADIFGSIETGGAQTYWDFQWGTTANYGHATPVKVIPAGSQDPVTVAAQLTGLKPGTTYHYRLVAVAPHPGYYNDTSLGQDKTFTTRPAGKLVLLRTTLTVRRGLLTAPLWCNSTQYCVGQISITARVRLSGRTRTVDCGSNPYAVGAGKRGTYKAEPGNACQTALLVARGHRLTAHLVAEAKYGSVQPTLRATVTLVRK